MLPSRTAVAHPVPRKMNCRKGIEPLRQALGASSPPGQGTLPSVAGTFAPPLCL
jgi:hypothetical protein